MLLHHPVHCHCTLRKLAQFPCRIVFLNDGGRGQGGRVTGTPQPRMLQHIFSADAFAGILHQQGRDQVLGFVGNVPPFCCRKVVSTFLDALEEQILAGVAVIAALPAAVTTALAVKRRIAAQQNVGYDT